MSQEVLLRIVAAGIYSLVIMAVIFVRYDDERGSGGRRRYTAYIHGSLLPGCLLILATAMTIRSGGQEAARLTLSLCFGIFLHISVYYMLLLPLLPALRRYLSARACAMLWMIPNYLYLLEYRTMGLPEPKLVLFAPEKLVWTLFAIWLAGFVGVLVWKTAQHLSFRRRVLAGAFPVDEPTVLAVWEKELRQAGIDHPKFRLVTSAQVNTPLSIGLFARTIRVVLPRRSYREEELELILRHELVHIGREDGWSKFFLVFCAAMCWFNPLMWTAMGRSAEDIELSCDETVLLGADEGVRRQYARLLLDTAGDGRGFTTCLSASAKTMRHRLNCVVAPRRRSGGAVAVALAFFLLYSTGGYVALAYEGGTGGEYIFSSGSPDGYSLRAASIHLQVDDFNTTYEIVDAEGFLHYLSGLQLYRITGNYTFSDYSDTGRRLNFTLEGPEGVRMISLCDRAVRVTVYRDIQDHTTEWYHVPAGTDWDYVLLQAVVPRPAMNVELYQNEERYGRDFQARLKLVWKTQDGQRTVLYEEQEEYGAGVYSSQRFRRAILTFNRVPVGTCTAELSSWDYSSSQTVTWEQPTGPLELELPDAPVHCTVTIAFRDIYGELCQAQFAFDVGDV